MAERNTENDWMEKNKGEREKKTHTRKKPNQPRIESKNNFDGEGDPIWESIKCVEHMWVSDILFCSLSAPRRAPCHAMYVYTVVYTVE